MSSCTGKKTKPFLFSGSFIAVAISLPFLANFIDYRTSVRI